MKNILAYGFDLPGVDGFEPVELASLRSVLDADIIVAELSLLEFRNDYGKSYAGRPILDSSSSFKFQQAKQGWATSVKAALSVGKTVVIFLTEMDQRYYYLGTKDVSGTGRNARVTNHVSPCSNYDFLPVELKGANFGPGERMKLTENKNILQSYWKYFEQFSKYNVYFDDGVGTPLVKTKTGNRTVGCLISPSVGGNLLLLPELQWGILPDDIDEGDSSKSHHPASHEQFAIQLRNALFEIDGLLRLDKETIVAPDWSLASGFRIAGEDVIEKSILQVGSKIVALEEKRLSLKAELISISAVRLLLYGTGHALEQAVRNGLITLGFDVSNFKTDDSEFDALFVADGIRFLGEVEGKDNKAISIDKASQLHRNLTEDFAREEVETMAVGVLFGNAFRETDPSNRSEQFTPKVLTFAATTGLSLVRTADFFVVVQYLLANPNENFAADCRNAIKLGQGQIVTFPPLPSR